MYQDEKGKPTCKVCDPGMVQNKTGQSKCNYCSSGTIPDIMQINCIECAKGTYGYQGDIECSECESGSVQSRTGQTNCDICPSGTFSDQSRVTCLNCPFRLGSDEKSDSCPFCGNRFYLKVPKIASVSLTANTVTFCKRCPPHTHCDRNTTIETIEDDPGFWRNSLQTVTHYACNNSEGVCLGGTSCSEGHSGVLCEVCLDNDKYFDSSTGECISCPSSSSKVFQIIGIVVGISGFLLITRHIVKRYKETEEYINTRPLASKLFGAAVCQVPLQNMKVYSKLLAGASWMVEYGNPDVPEEWEYLLRHSPYHLLRQYA